MKTHSLLLYIILLAAPCFAQGQRTTGGDHFWAGIRSIVACDTVRDTFLLTKGRTYKVEIMTSLDSSPEKSFYVVAMGYGTVGKAERVYPSGTHFIDINIDAVPPGYHEIVLYYAELGWKYAGKLNSRVLANVATVDIQDQVKINIFPNPATEILNVMAPAAIKRVEVRNAIGLVVYSAIYEPDKPLTISHLPAGVYNVVLKGDNETLVKPFVKID